MRARGWWRTAGPAPLPAGKRAAAALPADNLKVGVRAKKTDAGGEGAWLRGGTAARERADVRARAERGGAGPADPRGGAGSRSARRLVGFGGFRESQERQMLGGFWPEWELEVLNLCTAGLRPAREPDSEGFDTVSGRRREGRIVQSGRTTFLPVPALRPAFTTE